ncbi:M56 family metallopeptidase [Paludibaculum fermentans]|uniref:M56 family metallopeptidase n=1 Tax=Paludibaculum fermentans TaxID=1473598 RepID=UPI003EC0695A
MSTSSIINHLWQSSFFVLFAGLLAFALRQNAPKIRYWVWLSASLKFLIPFALLVSVGSVVPRPARYPAFVAAPILPDTIVQIAQPFSTASRTTAPQGTPLDWVPVAIGVVWALGFLAITVARTRSWLGVRAALRGGTPIELPIPIPALITPGAEEPGVVGFLRPVLVLPAQLLEHLTPRQLSAILTHEMCHVRRQDNLFAAVHMIVESIFWFHPLVWWIGSRLVEERELACDEEVLRMGCEPADYMQGILTVCRFYTESPSPCISGVTGADIRKRLQAILAGATARELSGGKKAILASIGLSALAVPILIGALNAPAIRTQSALAFTPRFEVASIRPNGRQGGGNMRPFPGRLTASAPLQVLMQAAYHVPPFQIEGGPQWMKSDQFELDARATGNPGHAQMMLMLQSLLADRFQLRIHRELREMPVFTLEPARGGLKLPPPREGTCLEENAGPAARVQPPRQGPTPAQIVEKHPDYVVYESAPRCGGMDMLREAGGWHIRGGKVPMAEFVRMLSGQLGRTVTDRTSFSGAFDVDLRFRADETVFNAVQQLGLRLESTQGKVEVLVIDHVERLSANWN